MSAVLMHPDSKQVDRLVVSAGGFLGVGGHRIAIPVDKFLWDASKGIFRLPMTTVNLRAMPEWTAERDTATGSSRLPRDRTPPTGAGN